MAQSGVGGAGPAACTHEDEGWLLTGKMPAPVEPQTPEDQAISKDTAEGQEVGSGGACNTWMALMVGGLMAE